MDTWAIVMLTLESTVVGVTALMAIITAIKIKIEKKREQEERIENLEKEVEYLRRRR